MDTILANAKLADWLKNFSGIESTKSSHKKIFQWMENGIIPMWMFPDITDRVLDIEDDEYFDEYDIEHHSSMKKVFSSGLQTLVKIFISSVIISILVASVLYYSYYTVSSVLIILFPHNLNFIDSQNTWYALKPILEKFGFEIQPTNWSFPELVKCLKTIITGIVTILYLYTLLFFIFKWGSET